MNPANGADPSYDQAANEVSLANGTTAKLKALEPYSKSWLRQRRREDQREVAVSMSIACSWLSEHSLFMGFRSAFLASFSAYEAVVKNLPVGLCEHRNPPGLDAHNLFTQLNTGRDVMGGLLQYFVALCEFFKHTQSIERGTPDRDNQRRGNARNWLQQQDLDQGKLA